MEMVIFDGREYPARYVCIDVEGEKETVLVAQESLERALMTPDWRYVSDEARNIDEGIYFYVPDQEIFATDQQLEELLNSEL